MECLLHVHFSSKIEFDRSFCEEAGELNILKINCIKLSISTPKAPKSNIPRSCCWRWGCKIAGWLYRNGKGSFKKLCTTTFSGKCVNVNPFASWNWNEVCSKRERWQEKTVVKQRERESKHKPSENRLELHTRRGEGKKSTRKRKNIGFNKSPNDPFSG